ncbi:hypothetical protein F4805DRAFT_453715 [Annulohypoxylon moriforme]|nr:hypothetical protein F4805DRAFT_453715 [Annulohypoxylon moriforme]
MSRDRDSESPYGGPPKHDDEESDYIDSPPQTPAFRHLVIGTDFAAFVPPPGPTDPQVPSQGATIFTRDWFAPRPGYGSNYPTTLSQQFRVRQLQAQRAAQRYPWVPLYRSPLRIPSTPRPGSAERLRSDYQRPAVETDVTSPFREPQHIFLGPDLPTRTNINNNNDERPASPRRPWTPPNQTSAPQQPQLNHQNIQAPHTPPYSDEEQGYQDYHDSPWRPWAAYLATLSPEALQRQIRNYTTPSPEYVAPEPPWSSDDDSAAEECSGEAAVESNYSCDANGRRCSPSLSEQTKQRYEEVRRSLEARFDTPESPARTCALDPTPSSEETLVNDTDDIDEDSNQEISVEDGYAQTRHIVPKQQDIGLDDTVRSPEHVGEGGISVLDESESELSESRFSFYSSSSSSSSSSSPSPPGSVVEEEENGRRPDIVVDGNVYIDFSPTRPPVGLEQYLRAIPSMHIRGNLYISAIRQKRKRVDSDSDSDTDMDDSEDGEDTDGYDGDSEDSGDEKEADDDEDRPSKRR